MSDGDAGDRADRPATASGGAATAGRAGRGEVLVYALGGGLGHLARARRVVHGLGIADRAVQLKASAHADDPRVTGGLPVVRIDPALRYDPAAVRALIAARAPAELLVDAFPLGILGELDGLRGLDGLSGPGARSDSSPAAGPRLTHVARRLRWDAYARRVGEGRIRFARTLLLEPLEPEHEAFLRARSDEVATFDPAPLDAAPRRAVPGAHWLVVHGGPEDETLELVGHARERQRTEGVDVPIVLIAPSRPAATPAAVVWRDEHPAAPFLAAADRVITAGGWNLLDEARRLGAHHHVVPFPRALDDQAWRAARARRLHGAR